MAIQRSDRFPQKLHTILATAEKDGHASIVSWLPGGDKFKVHDRNRFENQIMKLHFNQNKYKSFQRQLNLWGFQRYRGSKYEDGAYCHQYFLKDHPKLCRFMTRVPNKAKFHGMKKQSGSLPQSPVADTPSHVDSPIPNQPGKNTIPFASRRTMATLPTNHTNKHQQAAGTDNTEIAARPIGRGTLKDVHHSTTNCHNSQLRQGEGS